jgi:hypothetical protein
MKSRLGICGLKHAADRLERAMLAPKVIASERLSNSSPVVGLPDHHLAAVRRFLPYAIVVDWQV